jgi:hypothetical protein
MWVGWCCESGLYRGRCYVLRRCILYVGYMLCIRRRIRLSACGRRKRSIRSTRRVRSKRTAYVVADGSVVAAWRSRCWLLLRLDMRLRRGMSLCLTLRPGVVWRVSLLRSLRLWLQLWLRSSMCMMNTLGLRSFSAAASVGDGG